MAAPRAKSEPDPFTDPGDRPQTNYGPSYDELTVGDADEPREDSHVSGERLSVHILRRIFP